MPLEVYHLQLSQSERVVYLLEELGIPYNLHVFKRNPVSGLAPDEFKAIVCDLSTNIEYATNFSAFTDQNALDPVWNSAILSGHLSEPRGGSIRVVRHCLIHSISLSICT